MAQNDIYLVRQKVDGTFEEIAHSPFRYDAANITDLPDKANNTFHINTKLRVDELEVNGKTTVIHTDTNTMILPSLLRLVFRHTLPLLKHQVAWPAFRS